MQNNDALILLSKKVSFDPNSEPVLTQVLRIAVYDEYKAFEIYKAIITKFGSNTIFTNLMQSELNHYNLLLSLCEKYAVLVPFNDISNINIPNTLQECYELGVASEIRNVQMYDYLLAFVSQYPDVQDVFFRLQALSYNNHLPSLRSKLQNAPKPNVMSEDAILGKIDEFSKIASKVKNGDMSEISGLLSSVNMSLILGVLAGGLGGSVLNQFFSKNDEE